MEYLLGNQIAAIQYFMQCIPIAEELGIRMLLATPYQVVGGAYFFRGDFYKAIEMLNKSLQYTNENEPYNVARCHGLLGWCYAGIGQKEEATENAKKANEYIKYLESADKIIAIYHLMGATYGWIGEKKKGINFENRVIELSKKTENHTMIYSAHYSKSLAYYIVGELDDALEIAQSAIDYSKKWNIKIGLHLILEVLAGGNLEKKKYEKAIEYAGQGLQIVTQLNNITNASEFHRILGRAHYLKKNPDLKEAEKNLTIACEYADKLGFPSRKAICFAEYSAFLYHTRQTQKAKEYEQKSKEAQEELDIEWIIENSVKIIENVKTAQQRNKEETPNIPSPEQSKSTQKSDIKGVTLRQEKTVSQENASPAPVKPQTQNLPIPEGVYALAPVIKQILDITSAKNNEEIVAKLFKYVLNYSGFEKGILYAIINGKMECLGGFNTQNEPVETGKICKQAIRDSVIGKKDVYVENASKHEEYKLNPHVYSKGIKSVYSGFADTGKIKSIIYLETTANIAEINTKAKELIKHYQNIAVSILVK